MPEAAPAAPPAQTTPNQTPPPAPPAEGAPSEFMGGMEEDFADLDAGKTPPQRDEKGKFKPGAKPAAKTPEPPAAPPADKPVEKPDGDAEPPAAPPEPPERAKTPLRALVDKYEALKSKVAKEYEPQLQSLKAKVQELETAKTEETGPVLDRIRTLEEDNKGLRKKLAESDFNEDESYKTASEKYTAAWGKAVASFSRLTVREPDGVDADTGEPKFKRRPANENDLLDLANMEDSDMDEARIAMFGASADRALQHIETLRELANARQEALDSAKQNVGKKTEEKKIQAAQAERAKGTVWVEANKQLREKFPKAFNVDATDPEDVAAHNKGFALANLRFLGEASLKPEQIEALPASFRETIKAGKPLSPTQWVQVDALARIKMANHDRQIARVKKAHARIAELEKSLAAYEKSEPPSDKAGDGAAPVSGKSWEQTMEDGLDALDK